MNIKNDVLQARLAQIDELWNIMGENGLTKDDIIEAGLPGEYEASKFTEEEWNETVEYYSTYKSSRLSIDEACDLYGDNQ